MTDIKCEVQDVKCEVHHESAGGRIFGMYTGNDIHLAKQIYDFLVKETNGNVSRLINYVVIEERLEEDISHAP